jgi:Mg2+-importing ATPase
MLAVGALALTIPYLGPFATAFDFIPLPWQLMGSLALIVVGYVLSTEVAKHRFFKAGKGPAH